MADPTDISNRALQAIGIPFQLGDIEQGGAEANACLRVYEESRDALLRAAPWGFARRQVAMNLLVDASGATPNVSTNIVGGYSSKFQYEYSYPQDCMRIRYIPANQQGNPGAPAVNIVPPNNNLPLMPNTGTFPWGQRIVPSPYLMTSDPNFTTKPGPDGQFQRGTSPVGSTVILSNVQNAVLVYTYDALYPSLWDGMFKRALIAYMAQDIAMGLWTLRGKPEIGMKERAAQIAMCKDVVREARAADANEISATTADIPVDWIRFRRTGGGQGFGSQGNASFGAWGPSWGGSLLFGSESY